MNIIKKKSYKKALIPAIAIVIVAAVVFGYLYYAHSSKNVVNNKATTTQTVNLDPPSQDQVQAGSDQKHSTIENSSKDDANTNPTPTSGTLTVTMTANNTNNGVQQLRYLISQQLSSGTCTLTLKNGDQTITKTAPVQALASTSTCQGFDIATSGMTAGHWTADVTVSNGTQSGSTSSTFEI